MTTPRQRQLLEAAARKYKIDPRVLYGVWGAETGFASARNAPRSPAGASGPLQFMPGTAASYGVNLNDNFIGDDFMGAAKYLSQYKGRGLAGMLAAYNAGPAGNPNNPETQAYIPRVKGYMDDWGGAPRKLKVKPLGPGSPSVDSLDDTQAQLFRTLQSLSDDPLSESNYALMAALSQPTPTPKIDTPNVASLLGADMGGGGGELGKLIGKPIDRAGVSTKPYVLQAVRRVAGIYGKPITLGTGTQHNQMTVNGNVSDHWSGDAIDLPATGRQLIQMGQAALIDAGADPAWARKQTGGLFNINGAQIIFNTQEGGDHTNHLHYNPRAPKRR